MSIQLTRWTIQQRRKPITEQLAQRRRSWRETRYLLGNPANAERLRQSIATLNAGRSIAVEFDATGNLVPVQ